MEKDKELLGAGIYCNNTVFGIHSPSYPPMLVQEVMTMVKSNSRLEDYVS